MSASYLLEIQATLSIIHCVWWWSRSIHHKMNIRMRAHHEAKQKINQREMITQFLPICDLLKEWLAMFPESTFRSQLIFMMEEEMSIHEQSIYLKFIYKKGRWKRSILFHFISVILLEIKENAKHDNQQLPSFISSFLCVGILLYRCFILFARNFNENF